MGDGPARESFTKGLERGANVLASCPVCGVLIGNAPGVVTCAQCGLKVIISTGVEPLFVTRVYPARAVDEAEFALRVFIRELKWPGDQPRTEAHSILMVEHALSVAAVECKRTTDGLLVVQVPGTTFADPAFVLYVGFDGVAFTDDGGTSEERERCKTSGEKLLVLQDEAGRNYSATMAGHLLVGRRARVLGDA